VTDAEQEQKDDQAEGETQQPEQDEKHVSLTFLSKSRLELTC
jgi:hypothetical protein